MDIKLTQANQKPAYTQRINSRLGKKWKRKEIEKSKNNIKYLGVTITKQIKALYDRNVKTLQKEIYEECRRWKNFYALGLAGLI